MKNEARGRITTGKLEKKGTPLRRPNGSGGTGGKEGNRKRGGRDEVRSWFPEQGQGVHPRLDERGG